MLLDSCISPTDLSFEEFNGSLKIYVQKTINYSFDLDNSAYKIRNLNSDSIGDFLIKFKSEQYSQFELASCTDSHMKVGKNHAIESEKCRVIHLDDKLMELNTYVKGFNKLSENWDGYGAIPIYPETVRKVQWFLRVLPNEYLPFIDIGDISPCPNGTVVLDFENDKGGILSISFGKDYENFYFDIGGKVIDESEKCFINPDKKDIDIIIEHLKGLFSDRKILSSKKVS